MMRFVFVLLFLLFSPQLSAQNCETKILRGLTNGKIQKWQTIEIGLRFPDQDRLYTLFLEDRSKGLNPYLQHTIWIRFDANGKSHVVPAFYMQDCVADTSVNKFIPAKTAWPWRVRFAVPEAGHWEAEVLTGEYLQVAASINTGIRFDCETGHHPGYIQVAADHRFLEYTDHTPFFILGQNIPWADQPILRGRYFPVGNINLYSTGYYDLLDYMDHLAASGGNYVRFVMIDWSTGMETKELGVYEQEKAAALDTLMRYAAARGLKVHLSLDLTSAFDTRLGLPNPYFRMKMPGMKAAELLKNTTVVKHLLEYICYVYARWAFSPDVAVMELMQEHPRWEGYEANKQNFDDFFSVAGTMLRTELGARQLISTSQGEHNDLRVVKNRFVDFIDIHLYTNDRKDNQRRFKVVHHNNIKRVGKPVFFGEFGMINGPQIGTDANEYEACSDMTMHNGLWATAFMGTMGCALEWWQYGDNQRRTVNFPPLRWFLDSIMQDRRQYPESGMWKGDGLESFFAVSKTGDSAVGWVHNSSYWWGNMTDTCKDRDGKKMILPRDDDKAAQPKSRQGRRFMITGLHPGNYYNVRLYETRSRNKLVLEKSLKSSILGRISIEMPEGADYALQALPADPSDL
ncbi:MAG TPA: DUF5060 domain-containing protein [Bacteroidia bacterium]|nr:DUF5060 domain-containing protein [Bacteroidia bacterium]